MSNAAIELHAALSERETPHQWLLQPGGHDFEYWERNVVLYLRFYDEALNWHTGEFRPPGTALVSGPLTGVTSPLDRPRWTS